MLKIIKIQLQKTKTVEVSGLLGRDAYRKVMWGAEAELNEGEDENIAKKTLNNFIDNALAEEAAAMTAEAVAKRKIIGTR